jgi:hypothetical protein
LMLFMESIRFELEKLGFKLITGLLVYLIILFELI